MMTKIVALAARGGAPSGCHATSEMEGDLIFAGREEPGIGDRRPVSVAGEIGENLLGSTKRRLGVDDPVRLAQRDDALGESTPFAERHQLAVIAPMTRRSPRPRCPA